MTSISLDTFLQAIEQGAKAYDVRSEVEYEIDGLAKVSHHSLESIQAEQYPDAATDEAVYLICEFGHLSELAGLYLEAAGYRCVRNVEGGMQAWRKRFAA